MEQIYQEISEINKKLDSIERKLDILQCYLQNNIIHFKESNKFHPWNHLESSVHIHVPNDTSFYDKPQQHYE